MPPTLCPCEGGGLGKRQGRNTEDCPLSLKAVLMSRGLLPGKWTLHVAFPAVTTNVQ